MFQSLVSAMSLCFVAMPAAAGLAIASSPDATPLLDARGGAGAEPRRQLAMTVLYVVYQVTPALVGLAVMTLLLANAAVHDAVGRAQPSGLRRAEPASERAEQKRKKS